MLHQEEFAASAEAPIGEECKLLRHLSQMPRSHLARVYDLRGLIQQVPSHCCQVHLTAWLGQVLLPAVGRHLLKETSHVIFLEDQIL